MGGGRGNSPEEREYLPRWSLARALLRRFYLDLIVFLKFIVERSDAERSERGGSSLGRGNISGRDPRLVRSYDVLSLT